MIKIETSIQSTLQEVWNCWTTPEHIMNWNFASDDWHCPAAQLDLIVGGSFTFTMAARDAAYAFMQMSKFDIAKLEEAVR